MFGRKKRLREQRELELYAERFRQRMLARERGQEQVEVEMVEQSEAEMPEDWREDPEQDRQEGIVIPQTPDRQRKKRKRIRVGSFFTGGILSRNEFTNRLPVIVYVVFLMLLYIANGFHMQRKHSRLDRISDEIKQLKTVSVTTSAVRMTATRQSEIERLLREKRIPLTVGDKPPRIIEQPERF